MAKPSPVFAHILSQTKQNVELLIAHNQISHVDGQEILSRLSNVSNTSESSSTSIVALTQQIPRLSMSPAPTAASTAPPKVEARAIWEWTSEARGSRLRLLQEEVLTDETNEDWWTGRNKAGNNGLFPATYVEKLPQHPPSSLTPVFFPEPRLETFTGSRTGSMEQRYSSTAPPQQYPFSAPPQQYPPPGGAPGYHPPTGPPPVYNSYAEPPPGPATLQPVTQQQPQKKRFGGLGQTMAQSAAGGVGFGAGCVGAAIGGGIINSIF
ncbi:hypothetical protein BU15DRAFT_75832 [Melanogaster broomeanus]|nr:hypothetical protein BU15DRAFT_75832 [Melanogaster broomeanus]